MPMVFVLVGFVLGPGATGLLPIAPGAEGIRGLTELTLALILIADASTLDLRKVGEAALIRSFLGMVAAEKLKLWGFNSAQADVPILVQRAVAMGRRR